MMMQKRESEAVGCFNFFLSGRKHALVLLKLV